MPDNTSIIIIWLAVLCISLLIEAATPQLVAIWFSVASVIALILAILGVPLWVQGLVFIILALILAIVTRPLYRKYVKPRIQRTNADMVIGQQAVVTERVDNIAATGIAKVSGNTWTARSVDGSVIEAGEHATVVRIEGVKIMLQTEISGDEK